MNKRVFILLSLLLVIGCAPHSGSVEETYTSEGDLQKKGTLSWTSRPKKEPPGPRNYDRNAPVPESITRDLLPSGSARN